MPSPEKPIASKTPPLRDTFAARTKCPRLRRGLLAFGGVATLVIGLVGVMHHPMALVWLRTITPTSLCPVTHGTPEQVDRGRALGAKAIRRTATKAARVRPALGFTLDRTTAGDVAAWARAHDVRCERLRGNETLQRCTDVPAGAFGRPASFGPVDEVVFELSAVGVLMSVHTMRRHLSPEDASGVARALDEELSASLGPPSRRGGASSAAHLGSALMRGYVSERAFTDYQVKISATNLAAQGVMVREQYLSLL